MHVAHTHKNTTRIISYFLYVLQEKKKEELVEEEIENAFAIIIGILNSNKIRIYF